MIVIHFECGGEMVETRYPRDPDGDEKVVDNYTIGYVCLKCGARMDKESAILTKRAILSESAKTIKKEKNDGNRKTGKYT